MHQKRKVNGFLLVESLVCLAMISITIVLFYELVMTQLNTKYRLEDEILIERTLRKQLMQPTVSHSCQLHHGRITCHYEENKNSVRVFTTYRGRCYEHILYK